MENETNPQEIINKAPSGLTVPSGALGGALTLGGVLAGVGAAIAMAFVAFSGAPGGGMESGVGKVLEVLNNAGLNLAGQISVESWGLGAVALSGGAIGAAVGGALGGLGGAVGAGNKIANYYRDKVTPTLMQASAEQAFEAGKQARDQEIAQALQAKIEEMQKMQQTVELSQSPPNPNENPADWQKRVGRGNTLADGANKFREMLKAQQSQQAAGIGKQ